MQHHPIAITGMHRSGTSMVTRGLHESGLHLVGTAAEELIDTADDNPEGFWENKAIKECNDELLEATGGAWDNPPALPPLAVDDPRVSHVAEAATSALSSLRIHDHWGFKDPRTCLTAPYWLDLEPELRFIICVRHPLEVALSLKRRNQSSYSLALALWERYYTTVLEALPEERRIVTHFDTFFTDPAGEIARLCEFAGLVPSDPRVRSDLRHHDVGVSLEEANVSPSLLGLYKELCRSAGATVPRPVPTDEGRVRRLILDGNVAQRHADQRQAAIERLEEREGELRSERAAADADHRARIRDLEVQLAAARVESGKLRSDTAGALMALASSTEALQRSAAHTGRKVDAIDRIVQGGPFRRAERRAEDALARATRKFVVRPGRRLVRLGRRGPNATAHAVAARLPPPAQEAVKGGRRVARRGRAVAVPRAKAAAHRLPPPAQDALRLGLGVIRDANLTVPPQARSAAKRLPPSIQGPLRIGHRRLRKLRARAATASGSPGPVMGTPASMKPKAPPVPRGAAFRDWQAGYGSLIHSEVPAGVRWLVVTPGSPRDARLDRPDTATAFPLTNGAQPLGNDLTYIAQLEALRFAGNHRLVIPEGSRPWFRQRAELRSHVTSQYRTIADRSDAGVVFDLTQPAELHTRSLHTIVKELTSSPGGTPAVLDWTDFGIAEELPGMTTFRPPEGNKLPYLDSSADIVVVDHDHDHREAVRVAALCTITVRKTPDGTVQVHDIGIKAEPSSSVAPRIIVWSADPGHSPSWRDALTDRVGACGAELRWIIRDGDGPDLTEDHDVVIMVEPNVLPLPGSLGTAATFAANDPRSAVAAKIMTHDGRLESAGGTVFADQSVGLIASGSKEVRGPWHDYVRPVCWAPGFVAATAPIWESTGPIGNVGTSRAFLREWCSAAWAGGHRVVYRPTISAVRLEGDGGEPSTPLVGSRWQRVVDFRPQRPKDLSDGAWRYLLGHDDVEISRV